MPTLADALRHHARARPGKVAFRFLDQKGCPAEQLTYAGLDESATGIAGWLRQRGLEGRPVLLLFPTGADFIRTFMGCLYGGAIAVPSSLPTGKRHHLQRVRQLVSDSGARQILVASEWRDRLREFFHEEGVTDLEIVAPEDMGRVDCRGQRDPDSETTAFIQYSSGSTSNPRGVLISHGNLVHNIQFLQKHCETGSESVFGSWLPFFHDMGLIGILLHSLYLGAQAVVLSPQSFIRRPELWLRMISDYGVDVAGGPNFGYEHCLRRVRDDQLEGVDLSGWRVAFNGAEPVRAMTMRRFSTRFAAYGFRDQAHRPCYGLAEATLCVAFHNGCEPAPILVADPDTLAGKGPIQPAPEGQRFVACGRVNESAGGHTQVRIVDPESAQPLPDNRQGEIWVSGPGVGQGYVRQQRLNAHTFQARLADSPERLWLRTGDLGFIREGYLFVTGRLKDLIIFNGRNICPEDVEQAAMDCLGLTRGMGETVALGLDDVAGEEIVLLQEVSASALNGVSLPDLARTMAKQVSRLLRIPLSRVLFVRNGCLPRTTSGKKQRGRCRELLLAGEGLTLVHCEELLAPGGAVNEAGTGS